LRARKTLPFPDVAGRTEGADKMAVDIAQLLAFAVKNNASDLHLSAGLPPMIRVDGDMKRHQHAGADAQGSAQHGVRHHE
jgi:Tfp pilus assembly pilus retraction ATPase PilT